MKIAEIVIMDYFERFAQAHNYSCFMQPFRYYRVGSELFESNGSKILEDREEIRKCFNAVFKLTQPSDSYLEE